MKILKRLVPLLLTAALLFSLAACDRIVGPRGNNNANTNKNTGSESTDDPRYIKQPGAGMSEYDVYSYFERCYYPACFAVQYYGGSGLEYVESETIERDGHTWAPSAISTVQTLSEMESYVEMFFTGGFLDEGGTLAVIRDTWRDEGYLLDPHTAVGLGCVKNYRTATGDGTPVILASTASPFKFAPAVASAIGLPADGDVFALLRRLSAETGVEIPAPLAAVETLPVRFTEVISPDEMPGIPFSS